MVSLAIKEFSDAGFIMAVLSVNAIVGTYQEYTAGKKASALKKVVKTYASVLRDGQRVELENGDISLGDIVFFESGVKVPANLRLVETQGRAIGVVTAIASQTKVGKIAS